MNLSFITWNIWFDELLRKERTKKIMEECLNHSPDFVAFQEVTSETSFIINSLKKDYHIIGYPLRQVYDTLILSKYACVDWRRYELPYSQMGRNLLIGEFNCNDKNISVGTFHLESVFNNNIVKMNQLEYIKSITNNVVLMGDTNFVVDEPVLGLVDVFEKIHQPLAFKYTYCGANNSNIRRKSYKSRLDRIYLKNIDCKVSSFFFLGEKPDVYSNGKVICPSDHFGIFTSISIYNL